MRAARLDRPARGAQADRISATPCADHYPTGRALDLDLLLVGAPNFRAVKGEAEQLGVYGVRPGPAACSAQTAASQGSVHVG